MSSGACLLYVLSAHHLFYFFKSKENEGNLALLSEFRDNVDIRGVMHSVL